MKTFRIQLLGAIWLNLSIISADAQSLIVTSFTDSQITFTASGNVAGPDPGNATGNLYLSSSIPGENDWIPASVSNQDVENVTGSPIAGGGISLSTTVTGAFSTAVGDGISMGLTTTLFPGDPYSGSPVTIEFPAGTFVPGNLDGDMVLSWGNLGGLTPFGTFQASTSVVPEPEEYAAVIGVTLILFGVFRTKRRRTKCLGSPRHFHHSIRPELFESLKEPQKT